MVDAPLPGVVYIVGVPRSGSTLLNILLGSHSQMASGGELNVFSKRARAWHGDPMVAPCSCGATRVLECPFWRAVDAELSHTNRCLADLDVESEDAQRFAGDNQALLRALRRVSGKPLVVDSSKFFSRMKALEATASVETRPLVIQRSVLGAVHSYLKRGGDPYERATHWALVHYTLRRRLPRERFWMSYEDLATNPRQELTRAARWLGLEFEEPQLDWANSDVHLVSGSPMRLSRSGEIRLDDAWRSGLTSWQKLRISLISQRRHFGGARALMNRARAALTRDQAETTITSGP